MPKNLNETYFFINLFKYFSTFLSIYLSTYLFIFLLIYISIVLSIFLSIILSFYPLPFYISRAASSPPGVTLTCVAGSLFRSCVSISTPLHAADFSYKFSLSKPRHPPLVNVDTAQRLGSLLKPCKLAVQKYPHWMALKSWIWSVKEKRIL